MEYSKPHVSCLFTISLNLQKMHACISPIEKEKKNPSCRHFSCFLCELQTLTFHSLVTQWVFHYDHTHARTHTRTHTHIHIFTTTLSLHRDLSSDPAVSLVVQQRENRYIFLTVASLSLSASTVPEQRLNTAKFLGEKKTTAHPHTDTYTPHTHAPSRKKKKGFSFTHSHIRAINQQRQ